MVVNDKCIILLNEIDTCLNKCDKIISKRLNDAEFKKYPDLFFVYLTTRLITTIDSSAILLRKSNQNIYHLLSIGIILRSGILDCLHFFYLLDFFDEDIENSSEQTKLIEEIKRIHCNQIYFVISELKFIKDNSPQKITQQHLDFFNSCSECFSDGKADLELKNKIENYKNGLTAKALVNKTNKDYKEFAMNLFECYSIYSKYEHYGEFTHTIYESTHSNTEDEISRIIYCFNQFFGTIILSSRFLFKNDLESAEEYNQLESIFCEIKEKTYIYLKKHLPTKESNKK